MRSPREFVIGACALLVGGAAVAQEITPEDVPVVPRPAEIMPLASQSLLLDVTFTGERYIAVGERGHILGSIDGENWAQVQVPTRAPLTGVYFVNADHGWAVGHDAAIVATDDGGKTWRLQHFEPSKETPFLDVYFQDVDNGFAVGAYGLMYETSDGGVTWVSSDAPAIRDEELHFFDLQPLNNGDLLIAGEIGMMGLSQDGGETWQRLESPYDSSLFGAQPFGEAGAIVHGLRGNTFITDDVAEGEWVKLDTTTVSTLFAGAKLPAGGFVLVGLNGTMVTLSESGELVDVSKDDVGKPLSAVQPMADGLLIVGQAGANVVDLP